LALDSIKRSIAKRLARELWEPGARIRKGLLASWSAEFGVVPRTIQNWVKDPEFIAYVRNLVDEIDDAFDDGLMLALRGDGDKIGPNPAVLIWYGKTRFKRDEKLIHQAQRHKHHLKEIEKKAALGLPVNDEPVTYNVVVTEAPMPDKPEGLH
jgi:hypothetical protein